MGLAECLVQGSARDVSFNKGAKRRESAALQGVACMDLRP